jgi:multiple sugar transport system permease protein
VTEQSSQVQSTPVLTGQVPGRRMRRAARPQMQERRAALWGYLLIAPWLIGLLVFTLGPMLYSLGLSFTNATLTAPESTRYVGGSNWAHLFTDPEVKQSLLVTLKYLLIAVPVSLAAPLGLAVLLNSKKLLARPLFLTLFYAPQIVPTVAVALMWTGFLNPDGLLAQGFGRLGLSSPEWFTDPRWVMPALILIGLMGVGNTMILLLAGLQGVPKELIEAATLDGAGAGRVFWNIILPMLSPILFYNLVLAVIGAFQYFTTAYLIFLGQGGPENAGFFYMTKLYKEGFVYFNMGYASTLAWAMLIVCMLVTAALFGSSKRWVYYAAGTES